MIRHSRRVRLGDGLLLHYLEEGANGSEPLLLLHGFSGSSDAWGGGLLRDLAMRTDRRVIAVDLPGHGLSDDPGEPARYALPAVARTLVEFLEALGIRRAVWIGYSMGGRVALGTAVLHPERIAGLVLESTSPGLPTAEEREVRRASDEALAARIEAGGIEAFVDYWSELPLFATQSRLPTEVRASIRRRRLENRPPALAACLRGMGTGSQPSFWEDLVGLKMPSLILVGEQDPKFTKVGRRMVRRIPTAGLMEVPGAGHAVHLEQPVEWSAAVVAFLDGAGVTGNERVRG